MNLFIYQVICQKIEKTDWLINEIMARASEYQLLKTIHGIGDFLCVLIKVEIGYINRFKLHCYYLSFSLTLK